LNACIITIGDELLQGFTRDKNSEWLSQRLIKYDVHVESKVTVPDEKSKIILILKRIISDQYDYVFITGGLGPTHDDITRISLQSYFEVSTEIIQEHHLRLIAWYQQRNINPPENLDSQSTILSGSTPIPNAVGSALGMAIKFQGVQIFILPGVPAEMTDMMENTVFPQYFQRAEIQRFITLKTVGKGESKIAEDIKDLIVQYQQDVKIAFLPHPTGVNIRLKQISNKQDLVRTVANRIVKRLNHLVYSLSDQTLEEVIGKLLRTSGLTISIAESCTGGWLAKRLTDNPGSSGYFLGSITAYHDNLKKTVLNIPENILKKYGAVSEQTARLMAESVSRLTGSSIGVSTTGISGPSGGTQIKPVGIVFIGISYNGHTSVNQFNFNMNRNLHREMTCTTALNMVRLLLLEKFSHTR